MVESRADAIGKLPGPLQLRAIIAALNSTDSSLAEPLGWSLLDLASQELAQNGNSLLNKALRQDHPPGSGPASIALASRLAALNPEQQALALSLETIDWARIAELAALPGTHPSFPADSLAQRSLALHAARTGRPLVARALNQGLSNPDNDVALSAESALQVLAVAACPRLGLPIVEVLESLKLTNSFPGLDPARWAPPLEEDRDLLLRALADACASFESHRRRGVLLAAILLLDRAAARAETPLATWFGRVDHPSHGALRGVLRWCRLPVAGIRCWEWLWRDDLSQATLDRLGRLSTPLEYDGILSRAPLALRPKRGKRLGEIDLPRPAQSGKPVAAVGLIPPRVFIASLTPAARRGLPRIAALLRGSPRARSAALEPLLTDTDPLVRHALVRATPLRSLDDLCLDADARVARSAFLAWSNAGHLSDSRNTPSPQHQRLAALLTRSPHESVRVLAEQEQRLAGTNSSLGSRLNLRRRLTRDRAGTVAYLAAQILGGDGRVRQDTVMLVRRLGVVSRFERELAEVASAGISVDPGSDAARAAASAVAALGDIAGESSLRTLRTCLTARDGRVRANAVEAIGRNLRRRPRGTAIPEELTVDPHHRVRGNAIRAIISIPGASTGVNAGDGLLGMLSDEREMHRAAGAWAAGCSLRATGREKLGDQYAVLLARVCEMARFDTSPAVRRRALLAASQAQTELRAIITGPDQPQEVHA